MKLPTTLALATICLMSTTYALADRKHSYHENKHSFVDKARVIDAQPIYETISYNDPIRECRIEERIVRHSNHAKTPVILGSIIGGAIGNELGHSKSNKKVGAVVGSLLGGAIASDINRKHSQHRYSERRQERVCTLVDQVRYEETLVGYNVRYQYKGRVYHTTTANHPGKRIRIAVNIQAIDR